MPNVDFAKKLIEFNFWEHRRVWDNAIMPLTDAQFLQDTGYSWGSIQRECIHIMNGEQGWLERIQGITPTEKLEFEDYTERQTLRQKWDEIQQTWETFAAELDAEKFFAPVTFEFRGKQTQIERSLLVLHVMNHGIIHRTEILRMVADVHQPADFDLSMMQYLTGAFRD